MSEPKKEEMLRALEMMYCDWVANGPNIEPAKGHHWKVYLAIRRLIENMDKPKIIHQAGEEEEEVNEKCCPICNGSGFVYEDIGGGNIKTIKCENCEGIGSVEEEEK